MENQFFIFQMSNRKWNFKLFVLFLFLFSNVKQEIEFQLGSAIPVKSCKIDSYSYTFKALHCKVNTSWIIYYYYKCKISFFFILQMFNKKWYFNLVVCFNWNHLKLPVFHLLPELSILQYISSWILYYNHQCKTSSFDNTISYMKQEQFYWQFHFLCGTGNGFSTWY